jgi:hypothetical protein
MNDQEWYAKGLRFGCTQCGSCCTGLPGYVWFSTAEAQAIAAYLKISVEEFHGEGQPASAGRYARLLNGHWSLQEYQTPHGFDCVFLQRDANGKIGCAIYPVRPAQCRTWPFWPGNLHRPEDWQRAAVRCPGIAAGNAGRGRFYPIEQIRVLRDSNGG